MVYVKWIWCEVPQPSILKLMFEESEKHFVISNEQEFSSGEREISEKNKRMKRYLIPEMQSL